MSLDELFDAFPFMGEFDTEAPTALSMFPNTNPNDAPGDVLYMDDRDNNVNYWAAKHPLPRADDPREFEAFASMRNDTTSAARFDDVGDNFFPQLADVWGEAGIAQLMAPFGAGIQRSLPPRKRRYKCGMCHLPKVRKENGVLFCQCKCPICTRSPKFCKCNKLAEPGDDALFPSLPPLLPVTAPVPRSLMVGGGTDSVRSRESVAVAIATAQHVIDKAKTAARANPAVQRASHVPQQTDGAAELAHTLSQTSPPPLPAPQAPPSRTEAPPAATGRRCAVAPGSSRKHYGGKEPRAVRYIMQGEESDTRLADKEPDAHLQTDADGAVGADEPVLEHVPGEKHTRVIEGLVFPSSSDGLQTDADGAVGADEPVLEHVPGEKRTRVIEGLVFPSSSDGPSASAGKPSKRVKRKLMKPATSLLKAITPTLQCKVCNDAVGACAVNCKHKKCKARVCSTYCAGYRSQEDMDEAGGWACSAHMAHADDHAWFCEMCSTMTVDRNHNVVTPVICCDRCDRWCCYPCVGIKKGARLPREWFCNKCM
jgi:hypothetical protein